MLDALARAGFADLAPHARLRLLRRWGAAGGERRATGRPGARAGGRRVRTGRPAAAGGDLRWATRWPAGSRSGPAASATSSATGSNRRFVAETGCTWVRLWAEWPKLQPDPSAPPDFGPLDAEIDAARADGLKVMLTSWRFPRWANETAALTPEQDARVRARRPAPARRRPGAAQGPDLPHPARPGRGQRVRPLDRPRSASAAPTRSRWSTSPTTSSGRRPACTWRWRG